MKSIYTLILLSGILLATSCTQSKPDAPAADTLTQNPQAILGRWKLTKEEHIKTREKGVEYANQPTNIILHIQKNGYFIIYDTFIDPKWKLKGLPLIERRSKGQWELKGKQLTMTYLDDDTSYTETVEITSVNNVELITRGKDKKSNVYRTYGK